MSNYKIAFCGLGSIGKRHLRNVCEYLNQKGNTFTIDLYRSKVGSDVPLDIRPLVTSIYSYDDIAESNIMYDVVFVTNPTSVHYDTIQKFKHRTKSFFIEKPVFDKTDLETSLFEELKDTICYVACPLRYSAALQYVKQNIDFSKSFSVRAISSSYLPDWRPGQDYRKCYSAHRDMGGGVGIDLIHEWDYLTWLFGTPVETYSIQRKISNLEIDSDDVAIYIGRTSTTSIELHLDYFGRSMIRTLEMFLPDDTIRCDIEDGRIEYLRTGRVIQLPSERNEYQMREIEHFFEIINNKIENDSTMEHAFHVLKLAKGE